PARDEAVENRLHLVRSGVTGRAEPVGRERVANVAQLSLVCATRRRLYDLGAELLRTEACVLVGLDSAESMVDMERRDAVAERRQNVPEARRVGTARNKTGDLAPGRDQLVLPDERL